MYILERGQICVVLFWVFFLCHCKSSHGQVEMTCAEHPFPSSPPKSIKLKLPLRTHAEIKPMPLCFYPQRLMWPKFSLLRTIIYIRLLVTITSVILVRFFSVQIFYLLYGLCGGAWFQHVPTRNVPTELRPNKTRAPRVPSKIRSFFFFFYLILVEYLIQASAADTWLPLRLQWHCF